jgi:hypothetical protein
LWAPLAESPRCLPIQTPSASSPVRGQVSNSPSPEPGRCGQIEQCPERLHCVEVRWVLPLIIVRSARGIRPSGADRGRPLSAVGRRRRVGGCGPAAGLRPARPLERADRVAEWARNPLGDIVVDARWIAPPEGISPRAVGSRSSPVPTRRLLQRRYGIDRLVAIRITSARYRPNPTVFNPPRVGPPCIRSTVFVRARISRMDAYNPTPHAAASPQLSGHRRRDQLAGECLTHDAVRCGPKAAPYCAAGEPIRCRPEEFQASPRLPATSPP